MDMTSVIYSVLSLGGVGVLMGLGLGYASKKLAVEEDPRLNDIVAALPGVNCGGCGVAGCSAFARALLKGDVKASGCPVGGAECTIKLSEILGIEAQIAEKMVAYIRCGGVTNVSRTNYEYYGLLDCSAAAQLVGGGTKSCTHACMGAGTCVRACKFGAITITDGLAVVDRGKCTACTMCVLSCPKKLIELIPFKSQVTVACSSKDAGKTVRQNCSVGCIACKLCEKACTYDAIHVTDNIARIDFNKCTYCNDCVAKCPTGTIRSQTYVKPPKPE